MTDQEIEALISCRPDAEPSEAELQAWAHRANASVERVRAIHRSVCDRLRFHAARTEGREIDPNGDF